MNLIQNNVREGVHVLSLNQFSENDTCCAICDCCWHIFRLTSELVECDLIANFFAHCNATFECHALSDCNCSNLSGLTYKDIAWFTTLSTILINILRHLRGLSTTRRATNNWYRMLTNVRDDFIAILINRQIYAKRTKIGIMWKLIIFVLKEWLWIIRWTRNVREVDARTCLQNNN